MIFLEICSCVELCKCVIIISGFTTKRNRSIAMKSPLTEKQQKEIERLYRKSGWSIKKIAKHLHISDKRVSAFLRGKGGDCGITTKEPFQIAVEHAVKICGESIAKCTDTIYRTILESLLEVLEGANGGKSPKAYDKKTDKMLSKLYDALAEAIYNTSVAVLFTMPKKFKNIWVSNIDNEPTVSKKNKRCANGKKKCK